MTFPESRPTFSALREAFSETFPYPSLPQPGARERVRDAVCALVEELKAEGIAPEAILIQVRAAATSAGLGVIGDQIVSDAIRWCIAQYFDFPLHE